MDHTSPERMVVRERYELPKPIPEELSTKLDSPTPPAAVEHKVRPGDRIARLALDKLILPALSLGSVKEYFEFWQEHAPEFSSYMQTLAALGEAEDVMVHGESTDIAHLRNAFIARCVRSARAIAGEDGEFTAREAFSDTLAAYGLVSRFDSRAAADATQDREAVIVHNSALTLLDPLFVCLYESASAEVNPQLIPGVVTAPAGVAEVLLEAAQQGARSRGVSVEIELEWILPAWDDPGSQLLEYLEKRAPHLVTPEFAAICQGHSALLGMVQQVERGNCVASSAIVDTSDSGMSIEEVGTEEWAKSLAEDLAAVPD